MTTTTFRRPSSNGGRRTSAKRQSQSPAAAGGDWTALADTLLLREATAARASRGGDLDPLAGLRIDDTTAARTIAELAGDGVDAEEARTAFVDALDAARQAFRSSLVQSSRFSLVVRAASLD